MNNIFKTIDLLDQNSLYRLADKMLDVLIKKAAQPYNGTLDELPLDARQVSWERNKEDYQQYDNVFWQELKDRLPDYKNLNTTPDEKDNLEGEIHGDDPTPGPAYVLPGEEGSSPSASGNLSDFLEENIRDTGNTPGSWVNLQPRH